MTKLYTTKQGYDAQTARWNAKWSVFYVTRYSERSGRSIQIGKPYATVEAASAAAKRFDKRHPDKHMHFIDVVKP